MQIQTQIQCKAVTLGLYSNAAIESLSYRHNATMNHIISDLYEKVAGISNGRWSGGSKVNGIWPKSTWHRSI